MTDMPREIYADAPYVSESGDFYSGEYTSMKEGYEGIRLKTIRAALKSGDKGRLSEAEDRLRDMLAGDDAQAWKEARKYFEKYKLNPDLPPTSEGV